MAVALAGAILFGLWTDAESGSPGVEVLDPSSADEAPGSTGGDHAHTRLEAETRAPGDALRPRGLAPLDLTHVAAAGPELETFQVLVLEDHTVPRPVEGARVTLQRGGDVLARMETDVLGRARLEAPLSLADLVIESDEHVDTARPNARAGEELVVVLVPSGTLVGRVAYAGRRVLAEQEVRLWTGTGFRVGRGARTAAVGPSGAFQFTDLEPGYVTIALAADDEPLVHEPSLRIRSGEETRVTLQVPEARRLTGRVVTAESRAPLDGVTVRARQVIQGSWEVSQLGREGTVTGRNGSFILQPLAPARVVVSAEAPWGGRAELELDLFDSASPPLELAIPAAVSLEGYAVDIAGSAVPGARIVAVRADGAGRVDWRVEAGPDGAGREPDGLVLARTVADGAGRFRFAALPPDSRLVLVAFAENPSSTLGLPRDGRVEVRTRSAADLADRVRITLKGAATVSGLVVDGAGAPLAGVEVTPRGGRSPVGAGRLAHGRRWDLRRGVRSTRGARPRRPERGVPRAGGVGRGCHTSRGGLSVPRADRARA